MNRRNFLATALFTGLAAKAGGASRQWKVGMNLLSSFSKMERSPAL
jgi:hypothetical protein